MSFVIQYDYNSFNVIPNEPAQVGLQILGFINNLGTNIFLAQLHDFAPLGICRQLDDDSRPPYHSIWW